MGLKSFLKSVVLTLRLSKKSNRSEFLLYAKLVLLGIATVGGIGFLIQLIAAIIRLTSG
ncbi:MAG: protein translocase SEC61 complex subunit gamma [Nitrososphaerota archaeon]|nr:protein translocase SEC61 complex subunit gamma [Nitrososphaerota archaeon]